MSSVFSHRLLSNQLRGTVHILRLQLPVVKGATGLYKPVGGAGAIFCIISNMLHPRDPFFKIKKYLQII